MVFSFSPAGHRGDQNSLLNRLNSTFYILSVKEWNLDFLLHFFLWTPIKMMGRKLNFLTTRTAIILLPLVFFGGWSYSTFLGDHSFNGIIFLPHLFSIIGLLLLLKAFTERGRALRAWFFIFGGQLFIAAAITLLNENFGAHQIILYLSGSGVSVVGGFLCLKKIEGSESNIQLDQFHGYAYEHPKLAFLFLLSCLGLVGLPITPTFIGIDLVFSHIDKKEKILLIFTSMSFVIIEIAVLRIYSRIFLGQHKKTYHAIAYKSS